jgi:hypothetical protein
MAVYNDDIDIEKKKQDAVNFQTIQHMEKVRNFIEVMVVALLERGRLHDQSKLESPEMEIFAEFTACLSGLTFGSQEYEENKAKMKPALDHHYANNRHHPEHYKEGVSDMTLVDLVEMFCDWKAASMRHDDGNLRRSIELNGRKFHMSPQLIRIFENTVPLVE